MRQIPKAKEQVAREHQGLTRAGFGKPRDFQESNQDRLLQCKAYLGRAHRGRSSMV